jgi:hypothetical protein
MNHWDEDIEKVVKSLLAYVRKNGQDGKCVRASAAFKAAITKHGDLEWVHNIEKHPKAKIPVTAVIDRLLKNEFRDVKRKKCGSYRSAPVFFTVTD